MYRKFFIAVVITLFVTQLQAQNISTTTSQHRIIMQLSSNDTLVWKGLMNNLKHLKAGWGDSLIIEVVAHGPGIDLLTKGKTTQQKGLLISKKWVSISLPVKTP